MDGPTDHLAEKFGAMNAAEKIEWMIETNGWALEPVLADPTADPPRGAYAYTIGVPAAVGFSEIAIFGLTPVAANGLAALVVETCRQGTEIPIGVELAGMLDNELRCFFAPVDVERCSDLFATVLSWYGAEIPSVVQLLYPDRGGFLPYEAGYEQRMRLAQPIIGSIEG